MLLTLVFTCILFSNNPRTVKLKRFKLCVDQLPPKFVEVVVHCIRFQHEYLIFRHGLLLIAFVQFLPHSAKSISLAFSQVSLHNPVDSTN